MTKDNRLELTDLKIKLTIGDVEMSIVRSDNEAVGMNYVILDVIIDSVINCDF